MIHLSASARPGSRWSKEAATAKKSTDKKDLPRHILVEDPKAEGVPVLERRWYYSIEHEPGQWTWGQDLANVSITREALARTDVTGKGCLDIGTMDGLVPVLLARRKAKRIVAYDRLDFAERMALLCEKMNLDVDYYTGMSLSDFQQHHGDEVVSDVVIFSGVLYHMLDPMIGILQARSLVRRGGIVILETAAVISGDLTAHFNAGGRFYGGDNYWFISLACLDYMLRMARLEPLDCFFFNQKARLKTGGDLCRVCIPCRAVASPPADAGDTWIASSQRYDYAEVIDWKKVQARVGPDVAYTSSPNLVRHPSGSVDLFRTAMKIPAADQTNTRLALDDLT